MITSNPAQFPKVLLINNIPTHHQMPLAESLHNICGDTFRIAFCGPVSTERLAIGWEDIGSGIPWVLRVWESKKSTSEFNEWFENCDAVIGYPPQFPMLSHRISQGKLCFVASERIWKPSHPLFLPLMRIMKQTPLENLRFYYRIYRYVIDHKKINRPNCHLLAIGAYSAWDFARIKMFQDRAWTYGYFVTVPKYPPQEKDSKPINILWAGRFLKLKGLDILLIAASKLKQKRNGEFFITLIGDGPEKESIQTLAVSLGLTETDIKFLPPQSPLQVRQAMRNAHIFVLPSNYEEGWGAVINEAMAEGCLVVASEGVGSAPLLIKNGETGFTFPVGDYVLLEKHLTEMLDHPEQISVIGRQAWAYIRDFWSPDLAAQRLIILINSLLGSATLPNFTDGPCSQAMIIQPKEPK